MPDINPIYNATQSTESANFTTKRQTTTDISNVLGKQEQPTNIQPYMGGVAELVKRFLSTLKMSGSNLSEVQRPI